MWVVCFAAAFFEVLLLTYCFRISLKQALFERKKLINCEVLRGDFNMTRIESKQNLANVVSVTQRRPIDIEQLYDSYWYE